MQHHDDNTPEQEENFDLARFDEPPASVIIGDADNPLLKLSVDAASDADRRSRIELDSEQKTALSGLLAQAPALVQSGYVALNSTYRLSFSPDVLSKMAKVMEAQGGQGLRAIALDQQGNIIGNGILNPANGMRALAATTAVWQAMAIITAQVHLAEINARLAKIEHGVAEIRAILEADQVSKVESGLSYVRGAAKALGRSDLDAAERARIADQLEHIWRDCGQVARTLLALLNRATTDLAALPLSAWYWLDESADLAREAIAIFERRAQAYLMAEYVRCATIALREQLELNVGVAEDRLDELRGNIADWRDSVKAFFIALNQRVKRDLSATFNKQTTIDAARSKLIVDARKSEQRLIGFCEDVERLSAQVRTRVQAQQAGTAETMTVIVRLDERGQIAETYHIPNTDQEPVLKPTRGQA